MVRTPQIILVRPPNPRCGTRAELVLAMSIEMPSTTASAPCRDGGLASISIALCTCDKIPGCDILGPFLDVLDVAFSLEQQQFRE